MLLTPGPRFTRRAALHLLAGTAALPLLAACQTAAPAAAPAPTPPNPLIRPRTTAPLTAVQASTELALGKNRFALGLINAQNQPVSSGTVELQFFQLDQVTNQATKRFDADAVFREVQIVQRGVWVSNVNFDTLGPWGVLATWTPDDGQPIQAQMGFKVQQSFSAPGYGDPAPRSKTPTAAAVGDVSHICSHTPPCTLHDMSLDTAIGAGTPTVVVFATPALCTSGTCAPEVDAIVDLRDRGYAEQANFVHVEIYQYPFSALKEVSAVDEWKLPSEPWTFLVDRAGLVQGRFEGASPIEEIEPALQSLLA